MRGVGVCAVALLLLLGPAATAQGGDARVLDPAGDVAIRSFGTPVPIGPPGGDHLDLLHLWMGNETQDGVEVGFRVRRWDHPGGENAPGQRGAEVIFSAGRNNFTLRYPPLYQCAADEGRIQISRGPYGGEFWGSHTCVKGTTDARLGEAKFVIPRDFLVDERYVPLQLGGTLRNLHARTYALLNATDLAPDRGPGPDFVSRVDGESQAGDLYLTADHPVRASNGESTTLLYKLHLRNAGTAEHVAALVVNNTNAEWGVRVPARLRVAPGATVDFPALLAMNFSHGHGQTQHFQLRAESLREPSTFTTRQLGVRWLEIPQPAGHHDKLWFHARPLDFDLYGVQYGQLGYKTVWMNAAETDPAFPSAADDVPPTDTVGGPTYWTFGLSPPLEIGLHPDASREGLFHGKFKTMVPATTALVNVTVSYCDRTNTLTGSRTDPGCYRGTSVPLFWGTQSIGALSANGEKAFDVTLRANPSIGVLPFVAGNLLNTRITLFADTPQSLPYMQQGTDTMFVTRGSEMQLPLHEYHDPLDQEFEKIGTLRLHGLDPFEKPVNPGRSVVFRFDVTNTGPEELRLRLTPEGVNVEWARIHEAADLTLAPNAKAMATLVVEVPADAQPGERAELFFVAENADDPSVVALARVRASVVDAGAIEISDEAGIVRTVSPKGGAPAPDAILLVGVLAAGAVVVRKSRRRN